MFESLCPSFACINNICETFIYRNCVEFGLHLKSYKNVRAVLNPNSVIHRSMTQFVKSILCAKFEDSDDFKV